MVNQTKDEIAGHRRSVKISIVIPVYNSSMILEELYARLVAVMENMGEPFEIILVDDASRDNVWSVLKDIALKDERVIGVQLMRNCGQGIATLCGMSYARGELIVTLDDDLQHPPEMIPVLTDKLKSAPETDVVMAVPVEKQHNFIRSAGSRLINSMNNVMLNKKRDLYFSSFRTMRLPIAQALTSMRTPYPAIGPMILSITHRIANIQVHHDKREKGKSNYTIGRLFKQTMGNFIGYSMLPLRLLAVFGAVGIIVSLIYGIILMFRYLMGGISVPGWITLALILLVMSGFNFFAFAVLGEYLVRIFHLETHRDQFILRNVIMSGTDKENKVN